MKVWQGKGCCFYRRQSCRWFHRFRAFVCGEVILLSRRCLCFQPQKVFSLSDGDVSSFGWSRGDAIACRWAQMNGGPDTSHSASCWGSLPPFIILFFYIMSIGTRVSWPSGLPKTKSIRSLLGLVLWQFMKYVLGSENQNYIIFQVCVFWWNSISVILFYEIFLSVAMW